MRIVDMLDYFLSQDGSSEYYKQFYVILIKDFPILFSLKFVYANLSIYSISR